VGEFHYVHHAPGGVPYSDPNAMGEAVLAAAAEVGLRITLLDACYLHGGIERFRDRDVHVWAERVGTLAEGPSVRVGAAIHSVRAVGPEEARVVAEWAASRPLHAHVSEQPRENEECLAANGLTPSGVLAEAGALSDRFTAVHATHLTDEDVALLAGARACVCLCPTTERDLADGIGPARALSEAGSPLAVGSDSQAVIDVFEEARAIELDERLASGVRGQHTAAELLGAATAGGAAALGWSEAGRLAPGAFADLCTVSLEGVRLAGTPASAAVESVVFAGGAGDVRSVMAGGRWIVRDGAHVSLDVEAELRAALL
jgi:formiminoglutamate deiminase